LRSDRERLFDIDVDLVWSVAQNDLPKLGAQVRAIVETMG
jgi:uncharacterized protein with HEPN domain